MLLRRPDFVVQLSIEEGRFVVRDLGGEMRLSWDLPAPGEQYPERDRVQEYVARKLREQRPTAQALQIVFNHRSLCTGLPLRVNQLVREVHGTESSTSAMVTKFKF